MSTSEVKSESSAAPPSIMNVGRLRSLAQLLGSDRAGKFTGFVPQSKQLGGFIVKGHIYVSEQKFKPKA